MNVKIIISYDGSKYNGSQKQPDKRSIEDKLIEVCLCLNIPSKIIFSGRTDKGVHATGQVINIQIPTFWENLNSLKLALNNKLPSSIRVLQIVKVEDSFNARFWAKKRVYRYAITTKPLTPFNAKYLTYIPTINENLIKEAIVYFQGEHDFKFFHKKGSGKIFLRKIVFEAIFYKYKDIYIFKFKANSYLRSQIRLMVGFLLKISKGTLTIEDLKDQLNKRKHVSNYAVVGDGLYLSKVIY